MDRSGRISELVIYHKTRDGEQDGTLERKRGTEERSRREEEVRLGRKKDKMDLDMETYPEIGEKADMLTETDIQQQEDCLMGSQRRSCLLAQTLDRRITVRRTGRQTNRQRNRKIGKNVKCQTFRRFV